MQQTFLLSRRVSYICNNHNMMISQHHKRVASYVATRNKISLHLHSCGFWANWSMGSWAQLNGFQVAKNPDGVFVLRYRSEPVYLLQDLAVYLERCPGPGLAPDRIKDLMWQLLCGIDFLHRFSQADKNFFLSVLESSFLLK